LYGGLSLKGVKGLVFVHVWLFLHVFLLKAVGEATILGWRCTTSPNSSRSRGIRCLGPILFAYV